MGCLHVGVWHVGVLHVGAGGSAQIRLNTVSSTLPWVTPSTCKSCPCTLGSEVRAHLQGALAAPPHRRADVVVRILRLHQLPVAERLHQRQGVLIHGPRHSSLSMPLVRLGLCLWEPSRHPGAGDATLPLLLTHLYGTRPFGTLHPARPLKHVVGTPLACRRPLHAPPKHSSLPLLAPRRVAVAQPPPRCRAWSCTHATAAKASAIVRFLHGSAMMIRPTLAASMADLRRRLRTDKPQTGTSQS